MGRVARELLAVSEMSQAALVPAMGAWYNVRSPHAEVALILTDSQANHIDCVIRCSALASLFNWKEWLVCQAWLVLTDFLASCSSPGDFFLPLVSLVIFLRVQRLSSWIDKELSEGGELAKSLDSVRDTLKGPTITNPSKTFNSMAARWIYSLKRQILKLL